MVIFSFPEGVYDLDKDILEKVISQFTVLSEHIDGGMPGNSIAKELGGETLEIVAKYGDEALDLIKLYGVDAAQIILKYGDEGIKVMKAVDPEAAKKLFETLDDDVLDYALQQGHDVVAVLSRWSEADLKEHGVELALRAKKDAKVLAHIKKLITLGPIDPKRLTQEQEALINAIAANSTQFTDEGQVVLGKWVDYSSGFVEHAQATGSVHYNPHPDMWNILGDLSKENRSEVAWLINKQVVQTAIDKGLPVEYTLNGIPIENLTDESTAVEAIFAGAADTEIMNILQSKSLPIRMKELQELQKAGYKLAFDEATNSYILILP